MWNEIREVSILNKYFLTIVKDLCRNIMYLTIWNKYSLGYIYILYFYQRWSALQAFLIIVKQIFSTGILAALHNFLSFFMNVLGDQDRTGLHFNGKSTDIPSPFSSIWYHQFSGRYFNRESSLLWNNLWPRCSDTSPLSCVTNRQMSKSIFVYTGAVDRLLKQLLTPKLNCRQASWSLWSLTLGLL